MAKAEAPGRGERVVVAMSGGVDSSVAAALLVERGYEVIGVTMQIWPQEEPLQEARQGGCCSLAAVEDARRVADRLGIPYYVVNMRDVFAETVIDYFVAEYARGRTPNPCIACNRFVKFSALLRKARELDARYLATGHYARVWFDAEQGRHVLARGRDRHKDQSYVLYNLTQEQLAQVLFPLGELTKGEVRRLAAERGLPVAGKPESQEICFITEEAYGDFVAARAPDKVRPGPILDRAGRVLGTHRGLVFYTVGQRRGLGVSSGKPLYVLEIDPERNALVVGPAEETLSGGLEAGDVNLILLDWEELRAARDGIAAEVQIRYRSAARPAVVRAAGGGRVEVWFASPQRAVTPGQAAVFYRGDLVLGGGVIERPLDGQHGGRRDGGALHGEGLPVAD